MKWSFQFIAMRSAIIAASIFSSLILHSASFSQSSPDFDKTSLALRTALHFDPVAEGPLKKLVQLYINTGRRTELPALYLSHLSQYPDDANARVVLARIYLNLNDDRAAVFLRDSVEKHPQSALLAWTHHQFLATRLEPRALDELDRAISIEQSAARRALWLDELLKLAAAQGREDLIIQRFKALVGAQALTVEQRIRWARQALNRSLPKAAASMIDGLDVAALQGDSGIEAALVLAETDAANGRRAEAGKRLDDLLGKLAADYWRRREVLLLRLHVAGDAADRDHFIDEARKRYEAAPGSEAEAVAYAELLAAAQRKGAAIEVLTKAAAQRPESRLIETRLLDLFDATNRESDAIAFLSARLQSQPAREDLALNRIRLLLATGRSKDGAEALDLLLKDRTPEQRATTHLDTARWLRTRNLLSEAAAVLEKLIGEQPQRWDARKELGELYVVLRRADDLNKLLAVKLAADVAPEVRMEVVQFLVAQKQWAPARAALEEWIVTRKSELEGRLLLARICAVTGDAARADALVAESRGLCDTEARYAAWLNAAFNLAGESEREAAFVEEERGRIWPAAGEAWDAARLSRLLSLTDIAGSAKLDMETEKLVRAALADASLKDDQRRELQLRLLDVIERQAGREKEVELQLVALTKTPGTNIDDLNLRLALLYHSAQRIDLAAATIEKLNIAACQDAGLLLRGAAACTEHGNIPKAGDMLRRVVQLQPDETANWIQWTSALASLGDEHTLRLALRQMLAMAAKWKLHADSLDLLRCHLAASCWREAGGLICHEPMDPNAVQRALVILDEAERLELTPERKRWVAWTRARISGTHDKDSLRLPADGWIPFPDGLMLSAEHAQEILDADTAVSRQPLPESGIPPLAPLDLAWGYQAAPGARIQRFKISPDGVHVLVADDRSHLSVLDRRSGKLRWTTANLKSRRTAPPSFNPNLRTERVITPLEFAADDERVFLVVNERIECRSLIDGRLEWSDAASSSPAADMMAIAEGRLLHWKPGVGTLDARDVETGKLAWTRMIEPLKKQPAPQPGYGQTWIAAGVSADAGKVLAYANGAAVVRSSDGALLWQTSADESPAFPLELRGADEEITAIPTNTTIMPWMAPITPPSLGMFFNGYRASFNPLVTRRAYAHPMTLNLGGYAGMYGGVTGTTFLNWGSEGVRVLRGNAIWSLSTGSQPARVSVSGLPVINDAPAGSTLSGMLLGFAGGSPVMVNESSVSHGAATLWQSGTPMRSGVPAEQSFPAATLSGRTLLVASADGLMARDAVTGEELFRCELPQAAQAWAKGAWDQLKSFQSVRWSARGVVLYDGQGGSLVVDWRSAAHGGDWIVPLGLDKLGCLRSARQTASLPVK